MNDLYNRKLTGIFHLLYNTTTDGTVNFSGKRENTYTYTKYNPFSDSVDTFHRKSNRQFSAIGISK